MRLRLTQALSRRPGAQVAVLAALVIAGTVCLHFAYRHFMRAAYPLKYHEQVLRYASEYDFEEPSLIFALIRTESGFKPDATSHAKAMGLMQITKDTFDWAKSRSNDPMDDVLETERLYDPETNIKYGVYILSLLRAEFPDTRTMLAAYNAGIGNVRKWLKNPAYSEDGMTLRDVEFGQTRHYIKKIPEAQILYKELYGIA